MSHALSYILPIFLLACSDKEPASDAPVDTGASDTDTADTEAPGTTPPETDAPDLDGDGYTLDEDCDDTDASSHSGASEVCDGSDNDCDGAIDVVDFLQVLSQWGSTCPA